MATTIAKTLIRKFIHYLAFFSTFASAASLTLTATVTDYLPDIHLGQAQQTGVEALALGEVVNAEPDVLDFPNAYHFVSPIAAP
jgi:hypothetical protein